MSIKVENMTNETEVSLPNHLRHLRGENGAIIGYARVSTVGQNLGRQIAELEGLNAKPIFKEKLSGASRNRPVLEEAIRYARQGDVFVVTSMDRLGRSLRDLHTIIDDLTEKGVSVHFQRENVSFSRDENSPQANLLLGFFGAVLEYERSLIRQRQAEGIALAKAQGIYMGRPPVVTEEMLAKARELIALGVPKTAVAKQLNISRATLYRHLNRE